MNPVRDPRFWLALGLVGAMLAFRFSRSADPVTPPPLLDANNLFLTTDSESAERASIVLPHGPSEDARHVLGEPPRAPPSSGEYAPNEQVEWVASVTFPPGTTLRRGRIAEVLGRDWGEAHGSPTLFGRGAPDGHWTYALASGVPEAFTELKVAWRYRSLEDDALTAAEATSHLHALEVAAQALGLATVTSSSSPDDAAQHALATTAFVERFGDIDIAVILAAPDGTTYEGVALWDALVSLGIEWGDGDFFHWAPDGDPIFSVGTSTSPGYFFPETAAAGQMHVVDLDFGFSLGRTLEPLVVLEAMLRATHYVQQRLGGTLLGADGRPLDETALRARVRAVAGEMTAAGVEPGTHTALMLL